MFWPGRATAIATVGLLALALARPAAAAAATQRGARPSRPSPWRPRAGSRDNDTLVIETTHGAVRGREEYDEKTGRYVVGFYGIPFASPPVGDLRFRPPQHVARWEGVLDCTRKKIFQVCPQLNGGLVPNYGNEDCLYMNIYIPAPRENILNLTLPAFFWIYGGGFMFGDKDEFGFYDGKNLATSRNVIVMEPNYRVGALGFLALDELREESLGTTGNMGVQDQQMALEWAWHNARRFGADASRITIAGESAGAFSVCWHYVNKVSQRFFSAAIMESGTCSSPIFFVSYDRATTFGRETAARVGCDPSSRDVVACLRAKDYRDFTANATSWPAPVPGTNHSIVPPLSLSMPYGPAIDGDARGLTKRPIDTLREDTIELKPLILGSNLDEGTIFVNSVATEANCTVPIANDCMLQGLQHFFNESTSVEIIRQYEGLPGSNDNKLATILRDSFFLCPAVFIADAVQARKGKAWLYQFVMKIPTWVDYDIFGDYHSLEMPFVFNNEWPPVLHNFGQRQQQMADAFGAYWTNLARFADPNGGDTPLQWPAYTYPQQEFMFMDVPLRSGAKLEAATCDFWKTHRMKFYYDDAPL